MKYGVKTLVLITCLFSFLQNIQSQLRLPVPGALAADVKKVIRDYPNHFANLAGEIIEEHPQSTDYRCNFRVTGAEESIVTRYSGQTGICSWEAVMLTTESFEKARQKFRSLYNQLNNLTADPGAAGMVRYRGTYEAPDEQRKFTSVVFSPESSKEPDTRLKMELVIQFYAPMEWKVKVLVYDLERYDDERGDGGED